MTTTHPRRPERRERACRCSAWERRPAGNKAGHINAPACSSRCVVLAAAVAVRAGACACGCSGTRLRSAPLRLVGIWHGAVGASWLPACPCPGAGARRGRPRACVKSLTDTAPNFNIYQLKNSTVRARESPLVVVGAVGGLKSAPERASVSDPRDRCLFRCGSQSRPVVSLARAPPAGCSVVVLDRSATVGC